MKVRKWFMFALYAVIIAAAGYYLYTLYVPKDAPQTVPAYALGTTVVFASSMDGAVEPSLYGTGWSGVEPDGTWSVGDEAELNFMLVDFDPSKDFIAKLSVAGLFDRAHVEVLAGDESVKVGIIEKADNNIRLIIPAAQAKDRNLSLKFQIEDPAKPSEIIEGSTDRRALGMMISSITIVQ